MRRSVVLGLDLSVESAARLGAIGVFVGSFPLLPWSSRSARQSGF